MRRVFKCLWKGGQGLITLLMALLLMCNLYLIVIGRLTQAECPTIFGYSTAVIVSGSMEPALSVDDLILSHAQDSYVEGDIITFHSGSSLTTHRIAEVTEAGYITRGDANNAADLEVVPQDAVVGRVVGRVSHVGSVLAFLKTPLGMLLLFLAGILIIESPFLFQRRRDLIMDEEEASEKHTTEILR